MKIPLSDNAIQNLVLMLDDCYRLDEAFDDDLKIWDDFDCIAILQDLQQAAKHRSEDGTVDVSQETIEWLEVVAENSGLDGIDGKPPKNHLSKTTIQALIKSTPLDFRSV